MSPQSLSHLHRRFEEPVYVSSIVVHGFGRGSKQLGIPTANLKDDDVQMVHLDSGIYYGFAQLIHDPNTGLPKQSENVERSIRIKEKHGDNPIYPAVFSLGWNPHFADLTKRTLEAHILQTFDYDFYGSTIRIAICGYIRPEQKFNSKQELIDEIHNDIDVAKQALQNPMKDWSQVIENSFFYL